MLPLDSAHHALFAELIRRCPLEPPRLDDPLGGRFVRVPVKGRTYWYFDGPAGSGPRRYIGPDTDPEIASRVATFTDAKGEAKERRRLVSALIRYGRLKAPDERLGDVLAAMAEAGLFATGAVLIGRAALACFAGLLGVRMPDGLSRLKDGPLAALPPLTFAAGADVPPILDALRRVDPSFGQAPHRIEGRNVTAFANGAGWRVFLLAANHRAAEGMPVLPGERPAQPLRLLDILTDDPIRAALLHGSGVGVTVPAPARYVMHRLILSSRRREEDFGARERDVRQADLLVEALSLAGRLDELGDAYADISARGAGWRIDLMAGIDRLLPSRAAEVRAALTEGLHAAARRGAT